MLLSRATAGHHYPATEAGLACVGGLGLRSSKDAQLSNPRDRIAQGAGTCSDTHKHQEQHARRQTFFCIRRSPMITAPSRANTACLPWRYTIHMHFHAPAPTSTRPVTTTSTSSASIVPTATRPLPSIACLAYVFFCTLSYNVPSIAPASFCTLVCLILHACMRDTQLADSHILLPQTCSTAARSNAVAYRRLTPIHSAPSDTSLRLPRTSTLMIRDSTHTLHLLPSQSPLHSSGACSDCALGPHTTSLLVLHTHT